MKFRNTSHWPDYFVKRMLRWCIAEVEIPKGALRSARFRKRTSCHWSGHAWSGGRIVVSVSNDGYPVKWNGYRRACKPADGSDYLEISDGIEALVAVTAHELGHIAHFARRHFGRGSEDLADARARYVIRRFREQRDALLAKWNDAPDPQVKADPIQQRATKAYKMMEAWQRRLKLATTKLRKYRRQVRYYERRAATASL